MKARRFLRYAAGAASIIVLYLATAGVWASLSVEALLQGVESAGEPHPLTPSQTDMLLRIEDPTFFDHAGLDVSRGQGLTTITSSLARSIFLSGKDLDGASGVFQSLYRAVFACCKQIDLGRDVMALVLDRHVSKERQLRLYVSTVYMGSHERKAVTGLGAAAKVYFGKELADLSADEFMTLVAMIKSPNVHHPVRGAGELALRVSRIKRVLAGTCAPDGWFDTDYGHCQGE